MKRSFLNCERRFNQLSATAFWLGAVLAAGIADAAPEQRKPLTEEQRKAISQELANTEKGKMIRRYAAIAVARGRLRDLVGVARFMEKAALLGSPMAAWSAATTYYVLATTDGKYWGSAAKWNRAAAWYGYGNAQKRFSRFRFCGVGVPRNAGRAFFWTREAARKNKYAAQIALSTYYRHGIGVKKNLQKAENWLRKGRQTLETQVREFYRKETPLKQRELMASFGIAYLSDGEGYPVDHTVAEQFLRRFQGLLPEMRRNLAMRIERNRRLVKTGCENFARTAPGKKPNSPTGAK